MAFSSETYVLLQGLVRKVSDDVTSLETIVNSLDSNYLKISEIETAQALIDRYTSLYNAGTDHTIITPVLHNSAATLYYGFVGLKSSTETRNVFLYWGSGKTGIPGNLLNIVVRINKNDIVTWRTFSIETVNFEVE